MGFEDDEDILILVYELESKANRDGKTELTCGLTPNNLERMKAPPLGMEELINITSIYLKQEKERSTFEGIRRKKRKVLTTQHDKVIELAVFVDDELYKLTAQDVASNNGDPIERIQDLVFAYLNAVSICSYSISTGIILNASKLIHIANYILSFHN